MAFRSFNRTVGLRPKVLTLGKAKKKKVFLWLFARLVVPLHVNSKKTTMLKDKIEALKAQIADLKAENEEALEALRIKYLSKKGEITALFNEFREVAPEEKRELGQKLNELKNLATEKINALREATKQQAKEQNKIDITVRHSPLNWVHATRSRWCASRSSTSSHAWALPSPMVPRSRTTGTCSAH